MIATTKHDYEHEPNGKDGKGKDKAKNISGVMYSEGKKRSSSSRTE